MSLTHVVDPHGSVRRADPATSSEAAGSVSEGTLSWLQGVVFELLTERPSTDEELYRRYRARLREGERPASSSRFRTARHELGERVADTGIRRSTEFGRKAIVWGVA